MGEKALAQAKTLAEEQAAGKLRSPLHGIPIGVKDSIDTAGVAHHRRQRGLRISLPHRRRRSGPPPESRRRGDRRQGQHARIRRGRLLRRQLLGAGTQSMESGTRCRADHPADRPPRSPWTTASPRSARIPAAASACRRVLRRHRLQAHLRPGESARHRPLCLVARSLRTHRAHRRRRSDAAATDRGLRPPGYR